MLEPSAPPPPVRFVTDSSLADVARRLRVLGHDVEVLPGARLEELFEQAGRESRVVLTRSMRRPRRWAGVVALTATRDDPAATVRAAAAVCPAAGPPFSRCSRCNGVLARRSAFEAHGEVPGRVVRSGRPLGHCMACGQWFWLGSHATRLTAWLEAALGTRLEFKGRELLDAPPPGEHS